MRAIREANGRRIVVPAGTYRIATEVLIQRSDVRIAFSPGASIRGDKEDLTVFNVRGAPPTRWRERAGAAKAGATSLALPRPPGGADGRGRAVAEVRSDALLPDSINKRRKRDERGRDAVGQKEHGLGSAGEDAPDGPDGRKPPGGEEVGPPAVPRGKRRGVGKEQERAPDALGLPPDARVGMMGDALVHERGGRRTQVGGR
jgi:hypothetical protein